MLRRVAGADASPSPEAPQEMVDYMIFWPQNELSIIVVVVDDSQDDQLISVFARENGRPSENFSGLWGSAERDGYYLVAFKLIELGGRLERTWVTDNIHRELLEAILDVPHHVALVSQEIAAGKRTLDEILPRLEAALFVRVEDRSPQVAEVLAARGDD
jgi:hypothetical protein